MKIKLNFFRVCALREMPQTLYTHRHLNHRIHRQFSQIRSLVEQSVSVAFKFAKVQNLAAHVSTLLDEIA